jgi:ABC-2 type transport system ATP-binding protein
MHRVIGNLSKGQRQRVGLAQALLGDPEVLILDEPTVGLDPAQIIEVRELIKSLAGKHTIVLSTHILPEVTAICQKALIIAQGRVVAYDTLEGLQRAHAGAVTADGSPGPMPSLEEIFLKLTTA